MRFTPKNAIDQRFFSVGKNTSDFKVGEKVVVTWSDVWAKTLSERINAKHHDTTMYNPSYWFNTNIEKNITIAHAPLGAPGTGMVLEDLITCGAQKIIGLGAAGTLSKGFKIGDLLIPYLCKIVDEGTSQHYKTNEKIEPNPKLYKELINIFSKSKIKLGTGDWWTTDGFYRESKNDINKYSNEGILGVDMETSAMYNLGKFRNVEICNLLLVSDELYKEWNYGVSTKSFKKNYKEVIDLISSWILD